MGSARASAVGRSPGPPASLEPPRDRVGDHVAAIGSGSGGKVARASGPFRAHARRNVRLRALFTHVQAGWQRYASIENVGLGGARLLLDAGAAAIAPGDAVTLSFTAPTLWDPLVLRARIVWVTSASAAETRLGVAFEHKATEAVFALYELIVTLGFE
jgi:hypothetical protein